MKSAMMAKSADNSIQSGNSRVKVTISGWVNRAVRFGSSGDDSEFHSVENTESPSRLTIRASGALTKNISVVALTEFGTFAAGHRGTGLTLDQGKGGTVGIRHSVVDLSHKDMGTISLGHSARADASALYTGFTGTSIANSTATGPGADGIEAAASDGNGTVARLGGFGHVAPSRENRLLYRTPSVMGLSVSASLNQARSWSIGASYSGPPGVKDIGVVLGIGYRDQPNLGAGATTLGMSGGVQHNPSGLSVNGVYAQHTPSGGDNHSFWGAEVGWTGKIMDAGNTSVTLGYGNYERGPVEETTMYHLSINQAVDAAAADLYGSVSSDSGTAVNDDGSAREREGVLSLIVGTRVKF